MSSEPARGERQGRPGGPPGGRPPESGKAYLAGVSNETIKASVQVMSTLSPTLTFASIFLSSTRELYFQSFGPAKEIEGTDMSIAVIVAVIVRWLATVAPGLLLSVLVSFVESLSIGLAPGCCTCRTMLS